MTFTFRPAKRENVSLLVSLAGQSGSGKTWSAMLLAKGMSGGKRFAVIDTEAGRAKHYADQFEFDHGDLSAPFSPDAFREAMRAADAAGYPVIIIDSFSHCHAGEGGVLDMQDSEVERMAGDDWKKREQVKMAAWIKPKKQYKQLVYAMLQVRAHLIFCLRAEDKMEIGREDGKMVIRPSQALIGRDGFVPICDKRFPHEMTASFLLLPDAPGVPRPIKLQEQHRGIFQPGQPITEQSGKMLAAWAAGGVASKTAPAASKPAPSSGAKAVRNSEEADCTHCQCVVEVGMGWSKDGKTIHVTCVEDARAARGR